jgi:Flp pilus assembly protein TadG
MISGGHRRNDSSLQLGQATVEFALVLPVLVLFSLIVVQAGLVAKDQLLVHHVAREAARAAAVDPTAAAARAGATSASNLDDGRMSVLLVGGSDRGDKATATVTYQSPTNVPLVGRLVGDVMLSASVTMRVE